MKILQFGILLLPGYQWLDIAGPVDYLNQHTEYMLSGIAPEAAAKAPNINWHYISDLGNLDPVNATSGPAQIPTTTFKTSPRLDYLLVPGGNPNYQLSNQTTTFIETQLPGLKSLLTVCTGSMILAHTGILDGIHVATNKYALRFSAQVKDFEKYKKVKWVTDRRFVVEGKIWSSAGITSGLDLAAEFARVHFDPAVVKVVAEIAEYKSNPAKPDPFAYLLDGVKLE